MHLKVINSPHTTQTSLSYVFNVFLIKLDAKIYLYQVHTLYA